MYYLYRRIKSEEKTYIACDELIIEKDRIRVKDHGLFAIYCWIITMGHCSSYKAYLSEEMHRDAVHESIVLHRCYKFPFLKGNDVEIGPCRTDDNYRGKGIYPMTLDHIIEHELAIGDAAYMIIDEKNVASINGVQKVGFRQLCKVRNDRFLKRYIILSSDNE
ncbi:MAG: hypothetical protein K6E46_07890 [Lachnospiraceae bacterium]|nr:hypothetical protein [Lachnospiraceae bacterium]